MDQVPLIETKETNEKKIDLLNEKIEENVPFYNLKDSKLKDYLIQYLSNNTISQIIENGLSGYDLFHIIDNEEYLNKLSKDNLHEKNILKKIIRNEIETFLTIKIILDDGKELMINLENDSNYTIEKLSSMISDLSNNPNQKIFLTSLNKENEILLPQVKIIQRIFSNQEKYSILKVFNPSKIKTQNQNLSLDIITAQGYTQLSNKVKTEDIIKPNEVYNSVLINNNTSNLKNDSDFNTNIPNNNNTKINDNNNTFNNNNVNNNNNIQENFTQNYSNLFQYKPIKQNNHQEEEDNKEIPNINTDYSTNKIPGGFSNVNIIRNGEGEAKDLGLSSEKLLSNEQPYAKYSSNHTKKINEIKSNQDKEELESYMKKGYGTFNNNLNFNLDYDNNNNNKGYSNSQAYFKYFSEKRDYRNNEPSLTENNNKGYSSYYSPPFDKQNNNIYNTNYELTRNKVDDNNIQDNDNNQAFKYDYKPLNNNNYH